MFISFASHSNFNMSPLKQLFPKLTEQGHICKDPLQTITD